MKNSKLGRFGKAAWLGGLVLGSMAMTPELKHENFHAAETKKTKFYVKDGMVVGGDQAIEEVTVKDIRRAPNAGFERIVIDLVGNRNGEAVAIPRAPYFQVAVTPDERRIVVTVYGKPKLAFNSQKVLAAFKKSANVKAVQLLPRLEDDSWTFVLEMKDGTPVEVFELAPDRLVSAGAATPVTRVVLDVKTARR